MFNYDKDQFIVLDIETSLTLAQIKAINENLTMSNAIFATLGNWIAVTSQGGVKQHWSKAQASELIEFLATAPVVGWNITSFDLPIISITAMNQGSRDWFKNIVIVDVFALITKQAKKQFGIDVYYKLEDILQLNFGVGKANFSGDIPAMFETNHAGVIAHCEHDVDLELRVYLQALKGLKLPAKEASKYAPAITEWEFKVESTDQQKAN